MTCLDDTISRDPSIHDSTVLMEYQDTVRTYVHDTLLSYHAVVRPPIKVYPNPTLDLITIEMPDSFTVIVSTIDGKLISTVSAFSKVEVSFKDFPQGTYFILLRTKDPDFLWNERIIKQ